MAYDDDGKRNPSSMDYQELVCSIYCDALLQKDQSILNEFNRFCSDQLILTLVDLTKKQLHLFGSISSTSLARTCRTKENDDGCFIMFRKTICAITERICYGKENIRRSLLVV